MTYASTVLGLSGLAGFWPLDEAAGSSTAQDLGPGDVPLAYRSGGGNSSGPQLCAGIPRSFQGDGSTQWAQEIGAPTGTTLAATSGVTLGCWIQFSTAANGVLPVSRFNSYRLSVLPGMQVQAVVATTGSALLGSGQPSTVTQLRLGVPYLIVSSWDGADQVLWINGIRDTSVRKVGGVITSSSSPLQVLGTGQAFSNASIAGLFILDRGINAGECYELFAQGTLSPPPSEAVTFDFEQAAIPAVSAAPLGDRCASCGGKRNVNEATVQEGSDLHHPGCYAGRVAQQPFLPMSSSSQPVTYAKEAACLSWDFLTFSLRNSSPDDLCYLDPMTKLGVGFLSPGVPNPSSTFWRTFAGWATTCAILSRYGSAPPTSWLTRAAVEIIDGGIAQMQQSNGYYGTDGTPGQFFPIELAQTMLLLGDNLDPSTHDAWLASLLKYMNSYFLGSYFPYYANGNIELQNLLLVWLTSRLTGDPKWSSLYQKQYDWLVDPSSIAVPSSHNNAVGMGLVTTVAPQAADWSDGVGYLTESALQVYITGISATSPATVTLSGPLGGITPTLGDPGNRVIITGVTVNAVGANGAWNPTPLSATSFSIPFDNSAGRAYAGSTSARAIATGFDPDYAQFQATIATRLWAYSGDANILRLTNLLYNQCRSRCSSTWVYDATNGTRHSLTESFTSPVLQTLYWKGGRGGLSPADVFNQWIATYNSYRQAFTGNEVPGGRGAQYDLGALIMNAPDWPGIGG